MSGVNTPASAASSAAITAGASNPIVQISTFLTRLPAEVRVKIYQELFRNRHIFWAQDIPYFFPGRPSIRTLYHCKPLIDHGWPRNSTAILCSCKQIRSEAHPIFFDTITHHIDISNIVKFPDSPGLFSYDTIVNLELEMYCFLRITPGFIRRIFPRAANIILNFTEDRGIFYRRPDDPPLIFEILRADPAARNRVFSDARRLVYRLGLLEVRWKQIMESLQVKMDDWIPGQGQTTYQPIALLINFQSDTIVLEVGDSWYSVDLNLATAPEISVIEDVLADSSNILVRLLRKMRGVDRLRSRGPRGGPGARTLLIPIASFGTRLTESLHVITSRFEAFTRS